jgi:hypothetical protein
MVVNRAVLACAVAVYQALEKPARQVGILGIFSD